MNDTECEDSEEFSEADIGQLFMWNGGQYIKVTKNAAAMVMGMLEARDDTLH